VRTRCVSAFLRGVTGHKGEALTKVHELHTLSEQRYVSPAYLSFAYLGLNDIDTVLDLAEKTFRVHDPTLRAVLRIPADDVLHPHPRFQDLLRRLGIAP
jgi:hypothetical protein